MKSRVEINVCENLKGLDDWIKLCSSACSFVLTRFANPRSKLALCPTRIMDSLVGLSKDLRNKC